MSLTSPYDVLVPWCQLPEHADQTDDERLATRHAKTIPARVLVPRWRVKDAIYRAGKWPLLLQAQTSTDADTAGSAITVIAYLNDTDFENLNLDYQEVQGMLAKLISAQVFTIEDVAGINALADVLISPDEKDGITTTNGHLVSARQLSEEQ